MEITRVSIKKIKPFCGLVAFAEIVLDDQILLGSIGIHEKKDRKGYRITYPSKSSSSRMFPVCHPVCPELSKRMEEAIFKQLKTVMGKSYVGHRSVDAEQS